MKAILKKYSCEKWYSQVYLCGDVACEVGGFISHALFEKMMTEKMLQQIPQTTIIENYSKPAFASMLTEVQVCEYYEIKK